MTCTDSFSRLDDADVIFLSQDGYKLAPARVRCYHFAQALSRRGLRCEVLSFFDHLGAADQGGVVAGVDEAEKLRLNLRAFDALSRNRRAVLYVQKAGYHAVAAAMAGAINGNRYILDYDDHDLDGHPFRQLETRLPSLAPEATLANMARGAGACVASSHKILDLIRPYNSNAYLVHTVADAQVFTAEGRDRPRERFGDAVNILWCGDVWGHIPMKDIFFAIDAFALMPAAARAKARFYIIGFGDAWETLKARARARYPDLPQVIFHERIEASEFGQVMREMDIGVLPYADNTFNASKSPTKMFEYLLSKVTICATPVGEAVHCLAHEKTALFARGLEDYSRALTMLVEDKTLRDRLADAACVQASERYTLDAVAPHLESIIRQVMESGVGRVSAEGAAAFISRRLGRSSRTAPREVFLARQDLMRLAAMGDRSLADPRMWTAPLMALLEWPGLPADTGLDAEVIAAVRADGERLRNAVRLRPEIGPAFPGLLPGPAKAPALCKLASASDWDDPDWFSWARRFKVSNAAFYPGETAGDFAARNDDDFLNQTANFFKRSRGAWERIQWLYGLDRLGCLNPSARAVMACDHPDGFYLALTEWVDAVRVLDLSAAAPDHAARAAAGEVDLWLIKSRSFDRRRITVDHVGPDGFSVAGDGADIVIGARDTVSRVGVPAFLDWAAGRLRRGGVAAFAADVSLNGRLDSRKKIPPSVFDVDRAIFTHGGFQIKEAFDATMDDATLDRLAVGDAAAPHFLVRDGASLLTSGVWFLTR